MHLYHYPFSSNARRAVMTALLIAPQLPRPLTLQVVDLMRGEQRQPEFLHLNPAGLVPVLVDGDFVLTESHAIMVHLAELAHAHTLWPADAQARADVNRWLFWNAQHLMPAISTLNRERLIKGLLGAGAPDAALVAHGEAAFRPLAEALNQHLQGREWLCGQTMTLADLAVGSGFMHTESARLPVAGLPQLSAWRARLERLPAWQETEPQMPGA